ncbi:LysE family transporter [Rhodococcus sp. BP-241]|uniref:LysE family transporter n=1 Tax=Rhodococcus sp. BP-241 TaxID=2739441 RepID=UPI001C9BB772|nr:LysE family transporter [Rhodococcus sp. BP-241]MBY6708588.1 LysE family transporter [Rhodococcus sp. BP-241]
MTPGPGWFVVMPAAVTSRRTGWVAACGVRCGLLVHMSAAAAGVAAVILASATAFSILKWISVAYLVYLGREKAERSDLCTAEAAPIGGPPQASMSAVVVTLGRRSRRSTWPRPAGFRSDELTGGDAVDAAAWNATSTPRPRRGAEHPDGDRTCLDQEPCDRDWFRR